MFLPDASFVFLSFTCKLNSLNSELFAPLNRRVLFFFTIAKLLLTLTELLDLAVGR